MLLCWCAPRQRVWAWWAWRSAAPWWGGMHADAAVPGEDPASQADLAMQCPWCLMALSLALALPAQGMATLLADPVRAPPTADRCAIGARSAWVVLPPPRGPPATQTL